MTLSTWPHEFPKGYKQYRIMDLMQKRNGLSYTEIIKFAYELNGKDKFDKVKNRGYWSGAFAKHTPGIWGTKVNGWITDYCDKGEDGLYRVNGTGMRKFLKLSRRFKSISAEEALLSKKIERKIQEGSTDKIESAKQRVATKKAATSESVKTSPEVRLRGLQLDDKVAYRKVNNNESGVGYISYIELYSKTFANNDGLHIAVQYASIPVSYNEKSDKFYHNGSEIEIIKL